jgi:hypothetical protein
MAPPDIEALTDQLRAMYRTAWQQVLSELLVVQEDPARFRESRRLAEVQRRIETYMTQADQQAANWVNGTFPAIAAGASVVGFTDFTQAMRDAMVVMGQGLFDDLLKATTGVRRSTKAFVRDVVGREAAQSVLTGETALGAAQRARQRLQSTVSAVTYKDGSKVGLDTYTDMALRTTTGIAYNKGLLDGAFGQGIEFFEVFDGPFCGWTSHDDSERASGTIRPREECEGYPLAHPNCRRSFGPRPDVRTKAEAEQAMATNTSAATRQQIEAAAQRQATADAAAQGRARPRRRITDERAIKLANREARLAARSVEHADEVAARVVGVAAPSVAPLTTTLENIAQSLDAEMVGLHHALKDAGSVATEKGLADKIARDLAANPSLRTPALAASKISDVVRFSMEGPAGGYTEMVRAALDELGADGYSVVKFKSFWGNDLYGAGINAQLATPEGQMFELQFHTPESSLAKKASHDPYETLRVLEKRVAAGELTVAEARAIAGPLEEQMRAIFAGLPIPPGAMDL